MVCSLHTGHKLKCTLRYQREAEEKSVSPQLKEDEETVFYLLKLSKQKVQIVVQREHL